MNWPSAGHIWLTNVLTGLHVVLKHFNFGDVTNPSFQFLFFENSEYLVTRGNKFTERSLAAPPPSDGAGAFQFNTVWSASQLPLPTDLPSPWRPAPRGFCLLYQPRLAKPHPAPDYIGPT